MYQVRLEIPKTEVTAFLNANLNLLSFCELFSRYYENTVAFTFSSDVEFHVKTLDEIYHYVQDDSSRRIALPF